MKITRFTVWKFELPLAEPYQLSGGRLKVESLDSTILKIDTDVGLSGWGEACPWGHNYLAAHGPGVRSGIETIAPAIIGEDPRALGHLNRCMEITLPGHQHARSTIDIACWDIFGQPCEIPLWMLFGGNQAEGVA